MTHEEAVATLASERYLLDEMSEVERHAFEAHYFTCPVCAGDVSAGARMVEGAKAARLGSVHDRSAGKLLPFGARFTRSRVAVLAPWAAAAALAIAVGYESLVALPALRSETEPQAVTPVTLRPASRGAEPIVAPGGHTLALAIDVNDMPAGTELTYALIGPTGSAEFVGHTAAPSAGAPLLLLVPATDVGQPGEYVLSVRPSTGADRAPSTDYRFTVSPR